MIPLRIEQLPDVLSKPLDNEVGILEALLVALAKGQHHEELWQRLHDAALRDDRTAELAFAYEKIQQDRRLKIMPAPSQALFSLHVYQFYKECLSDLDGAIAALEKVLTLVPGHPEAFSTLVEIFERKKDKARLLALYMGAANPKIEKELQLEYLQKALNLAVGFDDEKAVRLAQQILKLDPANVAALETAEERLSAASKFSDVTRMLEAALQLGIPEDAARKARGRLVELYDSKLAEIEKAVPHVEELLAADPSHAGARKAAQRLLGHKTMAPRAAAAMEKVFEAEGDTESVAKMLAIQVEQLRGPKKVEAQKRLAELQISLGDPTSAIANLEAVVLGDLADEEAREKFVLLCMELERAADAARVLSRAAAGAKDAPLRGRINADLGYVYVVLGDAKRAKQVLVSVIDTSGDDVATLSAARTILPLYEEGKESKQIATALERIGALASEPEERGNALVKLATIAEQDLKDLDLAIQSLRRVMEVFPTVEARDDIERLLEATGRFSELAEVIEARARMVGDRPEAREMLIRAATLREQAKETPIAIDVLMHVVETFGPAHDVHTLLIPLLVQARRVPELLVTLAAEAEIVSPDERAPIYLRIARIRVKQGEVGEALEAFARVLALTPNDADARAFVEAAMEAPKEGAPDLRLRASEIMLPIYEGSGNASGLVSVCDVRATLAADPAERLAILEDGLAIASDLLPSDTRALGFAARGLAEAIATNRDALAAWVQRVSELGVRLGEGGSEALVRVWVEALGEHPVDDASMVLLAKATGAALVAHGDSRSALDVYRRALTFVPDDPELLSTVDDLLEEQGSPADRVVLYEAALERHRDAGKRRELFHKIGAVQRRDLRDVQAAIGTYRRALSEFPEDKAFRGALFASYEVAEAWDDLYEALGAAAAAAPPEERAGLERRLADVSLSAKERPRAATHFERVLELGGELTPAQLDVVEGLARETDASSLLRKVYERRLAMADTPAAKSTELERLGDLILEGGAADEAAEHFLGAARECQSLDDAPAFGERELALLGKVLGARPGHRPTLARRVEIARALGDDARVATFLEELRSATEDREARVGLALSLEEPLGRLGDLERWVRNLDEVLSEAGARLDLLTAKARALAPTQPSEAAKVYRVMLASLPEDAAREAATSYEAFLAARGNDPTYFDDRRALFAFRAKGASADERRRILFASAIAERDAMASPARGLAIVRELLAADPNDVAALELETELSRSLGDHEAVARSIERRAGISEGDARRALLVELATVLMDDLGRADDALNAAEDLLGASPTDPAALRILERALKNDAARARAGEMLERVAGELPEAERAAIYESLLVVDPSADGASEKPDPSRAGIYKKLLAVAEGNPERALGIALRAVGEFPEEEELWSRSEELARALGAADRVSMAYRQVLAQAATKLTPESAMTIGQRGVDFQEEWFDDPDAVAHMLKLIVDVAPAATWAFERLKLLYNAGERWGDLFALYDRVIEGTEDDGLKVEILEDAASVAKDLAGDSDRAIGYYEQLHVLEPNDQRTAAALERLYEKHGKHKPLIDLLGERLRDADVPERTDLRLRMAGLWLDGVKDLDPARILADEILREDDTCAKADQLLERILGLTGSEARGLARLRRSMDARDASPSDAPMSMKHPEGAKLPEIRKRTALSLKERYARAKKFELTARMIDVALESAAPGDERRGLLDELIVLERDQLGDRARAFETLSLLARLNPLDASLRARLEEEAKVLGNHEKLVDVLIEIAERCPEPADSLPILERASEIARVDLRDSNRVISIDLRILARTDQDPARAKEAAEKLDRELEKSGREAERCGVLERLAELESDKPARGRILHEVARIARDVIGDVQRASRALRQRLEDEPDDLSALSQLVDNLREADEREELARRLERRVELLDVNEKRRNDLLELARLHAALGDLRASTQTYERLMREHGPEDEVADELASVLERDGEIERLAELLRDEAGRATDPSRRASLYTRLGAVKVRMGARPEAAAAYAKALDHAPDLDVARVGLEGLLDELAGDALLYRTMVESLERAFRKTGAWERSLALVPARLQAAESNADRATIHMEGADLEEQRAQNPGLATVSTWKAFCIAPERDPIASELLRRARLSGRWDVIVPGLLEALEGRLVPVHVARDLLVDSSDYALREDAKPTHALRLLEESLSRLPNDVDALKRLVEARRRAPSSELCDALIELASALSGRHENADATLSAEGIECVREAVVVALRTLDDAELALGLARRLLDESTRRWTDIREGRVDDDVTPSREAASFAIDVLVELLVARGATAEVFETLTRGAKLPFATEARRSLLVRATEHASRADAIEIYQTLFDEDVTDVDVARELEARYLAEGRKADVVAIRKKQIGVAESVPERLGLRVSLASLFEEIGDVDSALRALLENLAEVPTDEVSVGFLARLYDGAGKLQELASLWEGQAKLLQGDGAAEMWERAAALRETLKDLPAAIVARKRIVDITPNVRSLDELARVLEASKKHLDAAAILERLIGAAEAEGALAESMVLRVASAYEAGGKRERALSWLEKYDGPSASAELRARLRASYRALSMLEPLAALLAREAESAPDPKTRMSRLKEAAAIFTSELHQPDRAIPLLAELLDLDKTDLVTRLLLSDALRANQRFEEAADILKQLLDEYGARRPKERALVHFELAKVALSLKDNGMAMRELEAASKIDQSHPGILHALAKLALAEGQLLRAQRTFRALLLVVRPQRGREQAFAATPLPEVVGKALEIPVSRAEVLVELAAIADKQGEADRKAEFIESAFEAAAENGWEAEQLSNALRGHGWSDLIARSLATRIENAVGAARVPLLLERAELLSGPLNQPAEALGAAIEALRLDPSSTRAHELSLRLAQVAGEIRRYTDALAELAEGAAESPALSLELSLFEARTKEREFADHEGARAAFERVLDRLGDLVAQGTSVPNVSRLGVLEELLGVLENLGDTPARVKALNEIIELSLEAQRPLRVQADLYHRLAKLHFGAGDVELAVDALEQAVNVEPEADRAESALREGLVAAPSSLRVARLFEDFCRQHKRNESLVDALVAVADRDEDPRGPLREAYETSMALGREDRAELLLLRIVQLAGAPGGSFADTEASAWALVALGERRLSAGATADACDLLERGAKVSAPDEERALLLRVARLAEESLHDPKRAVAVLEALRTRDPADREVWGPLARIHGATGDTSALSALLSETIPLVDDVAERSNLRMTLAEILLTTDTPRAAELLKEAFDESPADERVAALLAGIYRKDNDTAGLVALTERRLDAAKDREDKAKIVALSMELGRLHEAAGDDSAALEVFHAALDWDPQSRDALRAVVQLGMKRDDSVGLGDELDRLLAIEEGQAAIDLAIKVAQMKRAQGDELAAERALVAGLKAQPSNQAIREELVRAYTARGAKKELTDLDKLAALAISDPLGRKASLLRLSEIYRDELGDARESADCLDAARAADPTDRDVLFTLMDALSALGEHERAIRAVNEAIAADQSGDSSWFYFSRAVLKEAVGDSDAALADLEEAHQRSGLKYGGELRAHLEAALVRVARSADASIHSERALRLRLAELTAEQGDTGPARLLVSELLRREPTDRDALRSLARIEEMSGDPTAITAALERLAPLEDEAARLVPIALRLAEVSRTAGRPAIAKSTLERAAALAPSDEAIRAALKSTYLAMGEVATLARILVTDARAHADTDRVHAGLLEASELLLRDEAHAGAAIELLVEARPLKPGDLDGELMLADAYAVSGRIEDSVALTEQLIAGFKGRRSRELGRAFYSLYKARNREGNLSDALAALSKAFENDPQNARMARELGELAVDLDDAEVAQRAFRSITLMKPGATPNDGPSAQDKAQSYFHLGRIAVAQGDRRRAKLMLEKALSEEPNLAEARDLLGRIE
ncbi:MAG: hypothetical protein U0414_29895 [Polyangiaceae bacterium]